MTSTRFITNLDFRWALFRGFNLSVVHTAAELKAKNIPLARQQGANIGRYWLTISHDANNVYSFKPDAIATLDAALDIMEAIDFYMVLTVEVLPNQGSCDIWGNDARKKGVIEMWKYLANRYRDRKIIAAYDLMNEPRLNARAPSGQQGSTAEYIAFTTNMINEIRKIDPNHCIAVEVLRNQMLSEITPIPIKNLIYSPHGYSPLSITHQGINTYLLTADGERMAYPAASGTYVANYFPNVSYWKAPRDFQLKYNAIIWCGEFSCINWAPKNSNGQWTSTKWIIDVIKLMNAWGWSWCYHAWREWQAWDAEIDPSFYLKYTFKNGAPFDKNTKPSYSEWTKRSLETDTMKALRTHFKSNRAFI